MTTPTADQARAAELHEQARSLDDEAALAMYGEVLALDPNRPNTHYNIGLIYKYQGRWQESFDHNSRSIALDPDDEASNWNLAIAATALRHWQAARGAWHRLGLPVEPGDSPIEQDFGLTPVRLNPDGSGEVVWGRRIDPVRVRIESIPLPDSGYRCGDVVLHDHDGEQQPTGFVDRHVIGIATDQPQAVEAVLQRWRSAGRSVLRFERMLTPPVRH